MKKKDSRLERAGVSGYNKPKMTPSHPTKKAIVVAKKGDEIKTIRFGAKGYGHNYSKEAKRDYLNRSAGIVDKSGNKTATDRLSANYWSRTFLWPKSKPTTGPTKTKRK
jgi:hypothetical protein